MKNNKLIENSWVVCLPGFNTDGSYLSNKSGGSGWKENKIFQIKHFSDLEKSEEKVIAWPVGGGSGIFCQALRPATQWEIEHKQVQKQILYEIY